MKGADILIVDDEADIRELVAGILEDEGYRARIADGAEEAFKAIEARKPHLLFLDIWLQGSSARRLANSRSGEAASRRASRSS